MLTLWRQCSLRERGNFIGLLSILTLAVLFGGGSRANVTSSPIVYVAAVLVTAAAIVQFDRRDWARVRVPLLLLCGLGALMTLQLIPLPPWFWRALAGREPFAVGLEMAGLADKWRPMSLTPDLTLYGLIALIVPVAVLMIGVTAGRMLPVMVPVLLGACALTALVGVLQVTGSLPSFYRVSNPGAAAGLFANRNHQAALLVCAYPLIAFWAIRPDANPATRKVRSSIGLSAAAVLTPLLLITGSRGGLLFGTLTIMGCLALLWSARDPHVRRSARRSPLPISALAAALLVPVIVTIFFARDLAVQRFLAGAEGELRSQFFPIFIRMIATYLPWGSGFGSFDAVFRGVEPHHVLRQTYLNHAHNEPAELLIEGGVGGGLLMVAFVVWLGCRTLAAWRRSQSPDALLARVGSLMLGVLVLWSLVDYPLRTPSLAAVATVACLFLIGRADGAGGRAALARDHR